VRYGRDVLVRVAKLVFVATPRGEKGPRDSAEGAQDENECSVGHRFGTCGGGVAVDYVAGGERRNRDPVEACAGRSEDTDGFREQVTVFFLLEIEVVGKEGGVGDLHQLIIPIPHLAACVPEGTVHAYEVAPSLFLQCLFEIGAVHGIGTYDVEFGLEFGIQFVVPAYVVAKMQDRGL
jgi:hypothetical protein